jgi:ComF family protein
VGVKAWIKAAIDFAIPNSCTACKESSESAEPLCDTCFARLAALRDAPSCPRCAAPLVYANAPCAHCVNRGIRPFDRIVAIGLFDEPIRSMIHDIKYHQCWPMAEYLADLLIETERAKSLLTETNLIIPIPLHPLRQLTRGYNQAQLIATRVHHRCQVDQVNALARVLNTETQTHMTSATRRVKNLKDAFALRSPSAVRGKHVVLIDDVMTVGATLGSAARTLRPAKPASISAMVLAVADPRGRKFESV